MTIISLSSLVEAAWEEPAVREAGDDPDNNDIAKCPTCRRPVLVTGLVEVAIAVDAPDDGLVRIVEPVCYPCARRWIAAFPGDPLNQMVDQDIALHDAIYEASFTSDALEILRGNYKTK